jgi:hypothetical protein
MSTYIPSLHQPPPFLGEAVLKIISFHDRTNPISRADLVAQLSIYTVNERVVREQIKQLRRAGHLIGSVAGLGGGYYLIKTPQEFQAFLRGEYHAKIIDMHKTAESMIAAADKKWGSATLQLPLL